MEKGYGFKIIPLSKENPLGPRLIRWFLFAAIIVVIAVFSLLFIFGRGSISPFSSFSEKNVELAVTAEREIASGDKVVYAVKYANHNRQTLEDAKLIFVYPAGSVVIKDGQPTQFLTEEISLGEIRPGQAGEKEFSAYLVGERGTTKRATARLIYSPSDLHSVFETEALAISNITIVGVSLSLVAPPNAVSGQPISYILDYRNESSVELTDLKLKFTYPDGFQFSQAVPTPVRGNQWWEIKKIAPGEGNRITIEGLLSGTQGETKKIEALMQRKVDEQYIDYQKSSSMTILAIEPLAVNILVNSASNYVAQPGDRLRYQIKFSNNSEIELSGLTINAKLEGLMLDLDTVQTNGFFNADAKIITWNASSSPLLNRLAPGQYGVVSFDVSLKRDFPSSGLGTKDFVVKTAVMAETFSIPPGFYGDRLTAQDILVTSIKSLPVFRQSGYYQDPVFGSSGPLPPRANQKTDYTIVWHLTNTAGDVLKVQAKVTLPVGVEWENQIDIKGTTEPPVFKPNSREVVWDIGALPAGTGNLSAAYEARFRISYTPSSSQIGDSLKLMGNAVLEGEDGLTKQNILIRANDIWSYGLIDAPFQGTVQE